MKETLGNETWLRKNEDALKNLFPDEWTLIDNLNGLKIGFGLKLLGVDWRSQEEFGKVLLFLERTGLLLRTNGYQVRRNPSRVFK